MEKEVFWAIKGWDAYFGEMNGMVEYKIFKGTESEAEDEGMNLSYEVISSYSEIEEYIEEEVRSICEFYDIDYEEETSEVDSIRSQVTSEDTAWVCTELDESKLPTLDIRKLEQMFYDNPEEFLEKYELKYT